MKYDLTELVEVKKFSDLMSFTLVTRLGREILNVTDLKMGMSARQGYKIAHRALRLRQQGFKLELARDYAREAEVSPKLGMLALLHMHSEKEGETLFEYVIRLNKSNGK